MKNKFIKTVLALSAVCIAFYSCKDDDTLPVDFDDLINLRREMVYAEISHLIGFMTTLIFLAACLGSFLTTPDWFTVFILTRSSFITSDSTSS